MFAAQGITLDRQTLASWMGRAAWWLKPLHTLLRDTVMSHPRLFADETPIPAVAGPKSASSGRSPRMTVRGAARHRRR